LHSPGSVRLGKFLMSWAALGAGAVFVARRVLRARRCIGFTDSVVVITGGSRGLGLAIARELVQEGARLVLLARDAEELQRARSALEREAGRVHTIVCDVSQAEQVESAMAEVVERFARIDVLINNAGIMQFGPLEHMDQRDFEAAMDVHLWGPFHTMMAALPCMHRQGGGRIVNISSMGGVMALPHAAPYSTSKFALVGLSDALRAELARRNIFVTTVCPSLMRTGSHVNALFKGRHAAEFAWFAIGNAFPLASVGDQRAARRIVEACRHGDAHLSIGVPARVAAIANAVFPGLTAEAMALLARLLPAPNPEGEQGDQARTGWDSSSRWAPSLLTYWSDVAVARNNEVRGSQAGHLRQEGE
jgi:NAD(P)-dependent dehydrogenase (short-subunit alcohol dehydrogenase family)